MSRSKPSQPKRTSTSWLRESLCFALAALAFAAAGWLLFPSGGVPAKLAAGTFQIGLPTLAGQRPSFTAIGEFHGPRPEDDFGPHSPGDEQLSADATTIDVQAQYPSPAPLAAEILVVISVPTGKPFNKQCEGQTFRRYAPDVTASNPRPTLTTAPFENLDCKVIDVDRHGTGLNNPLGPYPFARIEIRGRIEAGSQNLAIHVSFSGVKGDGFLVQGAHVESHLPQVTSTGASTGSYTAADYYLDNEVPGTAKVAVNYWINDADQLSWSGDAPLGIFPDRVFWAYQLSQDQPNRASGVWDDRVAKDSDLTAVAGVIFGMAGAAIIAAMQAAFKTTEVVTTQHILRTQVPQAGD